MSDISAHIAKLLLILHAVKPRKHVINYPAKWSCFWV